MHGTWSPFVSGDRTIRHAANHNWKVPMSFGIYLVGYVILIVGLALAANMLNVPGQWIGIGALCLVGIAIIHGVASTRQKDLPS